MKRLLLGTAAIIAFAAPAVAADLPARTYTKAPAYTAPEAVYNWTGFYIGGHVGGAFGGSSLDGSDARLPEHRGRGRTGEAAADDGNAVVFRGWASWLGGPINAWAGANKP